ncbi:MAG: hypothetical protein M3083_21925 [Actinomycetota bacterium]|nr:hypothetical protein [Actinomycetota bacterium]
MKCSVNDGEATSADLDCVDYSMDPEITGLSYDHRYPRATRDTARMSSRASVTGITGRLLGAGC